MNKDQLTAALHAPYFKHKDPAIAEETIRFLRSDVRNLGRASYILFLLEAHPEHAEEWRKRYKFFIEQAQRYVDEYPLNGVGWNDYHMGRWLMFGKDEDAAEVLQRTQLGGQIGESARWMCSSMCQQVPEFAATLRRMRTANEQPTEATTPAGGKK